MLFIGLGSIFLGILCLLLRNDIEVSNVPGMTGTFAMGWFGGFGSAIVSISLKSKKMIEGLLAEK